jgi:hypothetical protein
MRPNRFMLEVILAFRLVESFLRDKAMSAT